jgi:pyruvate formate-lyase/glycerol dehydratase family glycyl radical enzyme
MLEKKMLAEISQEQTQSRSIRLWNKLIEARQTAPVSLWRGRLFTASWKETEGLPIAIRRARAFEKIMNEIPIYLDEEQLLAGNYGSWPMATELVWIPETTVEWLLERFEEGREGLIIPEKDIPELMDIARYWQDKSVEARYLKYIGKAEETREKELDFLGAFIGHILFAAIAAQGWWIPDYARVIKKGLLGLEAEIEEELNKIKLANEAALEKKIFLEALVITIKASIQYAKRHAEMARELAKSAFGKRKAELEKIAEVCERVPANPARTFQEAVQSLWFCNLLLYWDCKTEGISPGRVDQYLYPFYKEDIEKGRITREEAIELLELLRCQFSSYRLFSEATQRKFTAADANWFNCVLGGQKEDGTDATNELSYLWLEAAKNLGTPHPTLSVRVHENSNQDFLLKAVELCSLGRGYPAFFGDRSNIEFLLAQGVPLKEARDYGIAGCTLSGVAGQMAAARPMGINLPKVLELAMHDGIDPRTKRRFGPATGKFEDFKTYEEFYEAYRLQVRSYFREGTEYHKKGNLFHSQAMPRLFASLVADENCIKQGQPQNGGGCRYQQGMWYVLPQGAIDVADSLAAIKRSVFEEKRITHQQLLEALAADFQGEQNQQIHRLLLSAPKYGNDEEYADMIAREVYSMMDKELGQIEACYGAKYVQSPHSLTGHGLFGMATGALPSGRRAGLALADGNASPAQGMDKNGVTAVLKSAAKLDQIPMQGLLLNQKMHPSTLKTEADLKKFITLIQTYLINYGGKHIQFNVINKETLLDAQAHPANYRSLVIRVAGYSAFWVELDSVMQDEIIARTEQTY